MAEKGKIAYISIVNAIAIVAVIIGHLDITGPNNDPNTPMANYIAAFGNFQMPLFMCVSGYLYAMTSGYMKSYADLMKSKVLRLIVPFLFLSLFTFGFKLCLPASMLEHGVGFTGEYLFRMFCVPFKGPVPHLWFVISLFTIFMLSPLYKWSVEKKSAMMAVFFVLYVVHLAPAILSFYNKDLFALDKTQSFIVWFYLGIVMQKYKLSLRLNNWVVLLISGIIYTTLVYWVRFPLSNDICLFAGIVFVFAFSMRIAEIYEDMFCIWRNYTYQIYLLHMFPIMLCKYLYNRHFITNETVWFSLCWGGGLLFAIVIPTIVAKIVLKMPAKIRLLIGL